MLQKIKGFVCSAKDFTLETMKNHSRRLLSSFLALSLVFLAAVCSTHTFTIFDGQTKYSIPGFSNDASVALKKLPLENSNFEVTKVVSKFLTTDIEISYIIPLTVKIGNNTATYSVRSGLLGNILDNIGIAIDEHDTVSLSLDSYIKSRSSVEITDVDYVTETVYETIPFGSTFEYSSEYDTSTTKLVQDGKVGSKVVTCSVKYINGEKVASTVINEKITEHAIDSKTIVGTTATQYASSGAFKASDVSSISKLDVPEDLLLDANGEPIDYSSKQVLRATAYTHTGNKCSTGVYPKPGYVAVDQKEIPYGTKMYIVSADGKYHYGYAIAADTGGFIYGTRTDMDLFLDTESQCVNFGRRDIIVYFLG